MAEIKTVDYLSEAKARETTPFNNDEVFEQILTLILAQSNQLQQSLADVSKYAGLDAATGNSLDLIGDIVGQKRILPANAAELGLLTYFGFDNAENSGTFGDVNEVTIGSAFIDQDQISGGVITLGDDAYRFFIRAKIISNTTAATPEDVITASSFLLDLPDITYAELNATIYLGLGRKLDETDGLVSAGIDEKVAAYLYIPRPAGVALFLYDYDPDDVFGFEGDKGSKGFGDLTDTLIGGTFASSF
jgi:hypothetical protein